MDLALLYVADIVFEASDVAGSGSGAILLDMGSFRRQTILLIFVPPIEIVMDRVEKELETRRQESSLRSIDLKLDTP